MKLDELFESIEDISKLKEFKQTKNAWLNPAGDIFPTHMYNHARFFIENDMKYKEIDELINMYNEKYNKITDVENYDSDEIGELDSDLDAEILNFVYNKGWGRLGIYRYNDLIVELTCKENNIKKLQKSAEDIAEVIGAKLKVHVEK